MDLSSYADLAIQLVNTGRPGDDRLRDLDAVRELLTVRPHLTGRVRPGDLDAMRELRRDLRAIFEAVAGGDEENAVERINSLLIQHPIHPQVSGHDGQGWHLHITGSGSIPDRYAAGAVMGLAVFVSSIGVDRLGLCSAPACGNAYFDTSSNRSRRYCSDRCARRANAAAHRARRRSEGRGQ